MDTKTPTLPVRTFQTLRAQTNSYGQRQRSDAHEHPCAARAAGHPRRLTFRVAWGLTEVAPQVSHEGPSHEEKTEAGAKAGDLSPAHASHYPQLAAQIKS